MGKLDGKVAIITGGAAGIGKATARLYAQEGAQIVIADISDIGIETANDIREATDSEATFIKTDVTNSADVKSMINHALDTFGRVDILMNNAGAGSAPAPIHATDDDDWSKIIDICLKGVFLGTKYALPQMMEQQSGNIINVASIAGIIGSPGLAAYAAAKAGVIELTKTTAAEYSRYGIRCNCLAPGWTKTQMVADYISGDEATEKRMLRGVPLRRFGDVSEIAQSALFLADDGAAFLQGHTLVLDGGITII